MTDISGNSKQKWENMLSEITNMEYMVVKCQSIIRKLYPKAEKFETDVSATLNTFLNSKQALITKKTAIIKSWFKQHLQIWREKKIPCTWDFVLLCFVICINLGRKRIEISFEWAWSSIGWRCIWTIIVWNFTPIHWSKTHTQRTITRLGEYSNRKFDARKLNNQL